MAVVASGSRAACFSQMNQKIQQISPNLSSYQVVFNKSIKNFINPFLSICRSEPFALRKGLPTVELHDERVQAFVRRNIAWCHQSVIQMRDRYQGDAAHFEVCLGRLKGSFSRVELFGLSANERIVLAELTIDVNARIQSLIQDQELINFAIEHTGQYTTLISTLRNKQWTTIECPSLDLRDPLIYQLPESRAEANIQITVITRMYQHYKKMVDTHAEYIHQSLGAYRTISQCIEYVRYST